MKNPADCERLHPDGGTDHDAWRPVPGCAQHILHATRGCCNGCLQGHIGPASGNCSSQFGSNHLVGGTGGNGKLRGQRASRRSRPQPPRQFPAVPPAVIPGLDSRRLRCQSRYAGRLRPADVSCARRRRWHAGVCCRRRPRVLALPRAGSSVTR